MQVEVMNAVPKARMGANLPPSVLSNADVDVLFSGHAARSAAVAVFFGYADVLSCVAVVTTGTALLSVSIALTFPSSAFDRDTLVSLDFGGV